MILPGFTAESSLYRGSESYYSTKNFSSTVRAVHPALLRTCDSGCLDGCLNACQDACLIFGKPSLSCVRNCATSCRNVCCQ
jgi:hypothetical protein